MKKIVAILGVALLLSACAQKPQPSPEPAPPAPGAPSAPTSPPGQSQQPVQPPPAAEPAPQWVSRPEENKAFRNIKVRKDGPGAYTVAGQARVFEASFVYDVEDGHNLLHRGYAMASEGAPGWGDFTIQVKAKPPENGSLHIILWEASAKDGSRTNELPVLLDKNP